MPKRFMGDHQRQGQTSNMSEHEVLHARAGHGGGFSGAKSKRTKRRQELLAEQERHAMDKPKELKDQTDGDLSEVKKDPKYAGKAWKVWLEKKISEPDPVKDAPDPNRAIIGAKDEEDYKRRKQGLGGKGGCRGVGCDKKATKKLIAWVRDHEAGTTPEKPILSDRMHKEIINVCPDCHKRALDIKERDEKKIQEDANKTYVTKPIPDSKGGKGSFQHCINANKDKKNPGGWCKQIERKIEGKKKAKKTCPGCDALGGRDEHYESLFIDDEGKKKLDIMHDEDPDHFHGWIKHTNDEADQDQMFGGGTVPSIAEQKKQLGEKKKGKDEGEEEEVKISTYKKLTRIKDRLQAHKKKGLGALGEGKLNRKTGKPMKLKLRKITLDEFESEKKIDEKARKKRESKEAADYFVEEIRANIIYHNKIFPLVGMIAGSVARGVSAGAKKVGGDILGEVGDMAKEQSEEEQ